LWGGGGIIAWKGGGMLGRKGGSILGGWNIYYFLILLFIYLFIYLFCCFPSLFYFFVFLLFIYLFFHFLFRTGGSQGGRIREQSFGKGGAWEGIALGRVEHWEDRTLEGRGGALGARVGAWGTYGEGSIRRVGALRDRGRALIGRGSINFHGMINASPPTLGKNSDNDYDE